MFIRRFRLDYSDSKEELATFMVEACVLKFDSREDTIAFFKNHLRVSYEANILKHWLIWVIKVTFRYFSLFIDNTQILYKCRPLGYQTGI